MNGIQWEGDIAFLLQGEWIQTPFDFEVPCPFEPPKGPCNHRIDLASRLDPDILQQFPADDPLVQAMSPVPKGITDKIPYLAADDASLVIATLARMSSPRRLPIAPFWSLNPSQIIRALSTTNVQPLVLTGVQSNKRVQLDRVLQAAPLLPRRLILQGEAQVILRPEAEKISNTLVQEHLTDLIALPWEAFGAHLLRQHMLQQGN